MTIQQKILNHVNKLLKGKDFTAEYIEEGLLRVEIKSIDYTDQLRNYLMRKGNMKMGGWVEGKERTIVFNVNIED